jgi:hypothetical protein
MITGTGGTSKKSLGLVSSELKFSAAYVTDKHKGTAFAKKFKEAVVMAKKHENIFTQFTTTFNSSVIKKWTAMAEKWEDDRTAPNPYKAPEPGPLTFLFVGMPILNLS